MQWLWGSLAGAGGAGTLVVHQSPVWAEYLAGGENRHIF